MTVSGGGYEALARVFKALGDETRLRLVSELARRGQVTCGEFATMCACSNSALIYHQRVRNDAGLIAVRRAGQFRVLTLRRETLEAILPGFLARLASAADGAITVPTPLVAEGSDLVLCGADDEAARPLPLA